MKKDDEISGLTKQFEDLKLRMREMEYMYESKLSEVCNERDIILQALKDKDNEMNICLREER